MLRYMKPLLLLIAGCISSQLFAQETSLAGDTAIKQALIAIDSFQTQEAKRDSVLHHPLGSNTEEDFARRYNFFCTINDRLSAIDKKKLSFDDNINLELLQYSIGDEISSYRYKSYLNPILSDEGFHTGLAAMGDELPGSRAAFEDYIDRLKDIPRYVDEFICLMRKGLSLGICQPRSILDGYQNTYEQQIVDSPEQSVFWKPFSQKPVAISNKDWAILQAAGREAIMHDAVKAYKHIKLFFDKEYLPHTRKTIGVLHFPDGLAYYKDRVRHYSTTDLSYDEIYNLGLQEVARIHAEMLAVLKEVHFNGTLKAFIGYLRTNPKFYVSTADQLLKEASFIAKNADGQLPMFFGKLPRQPYSVEPVPAHLAPTYTAGRYSGAPVNSRRAGEYWVNTFDLKSRPLYVLEALTLHEAVPGHHLQIALAQELTNLPAFRQHLYVNAFGEGWGLYAEYLGTEMGFYKNPYAHFGRLTYEMWRACRLVIDVGLHAKGWTKQQAVDYLAAHTALSMHEVNTEVNRYISWPGQALAYKIGELKIRELRKRAEDKLKEKFDLREFHDLVLSQGTVTLGILEKMVDRYIQQKLQQP